MRVRGGRNSMSFEQCAHSPRKYQSPHLLVCELLKGPDADVHVVHVTAWRVTGDGRRVTGVGGVWIGSASSCGRAPHSQGAVGSARFVLATLVPRQFACRGLTAPALIGVVVAGIVARAPAAARTECNIKGGSQRYETGLRRRQAGPSGAMMHGCARVAGQGHAQGVSRGAGRGGGAAWRDERGARELGSRVGGAQDDAALFADVGAVKALAVAVVHPP